MKSKSTLGKVIPLYIIDPPEVQARVGKNSYDRVAKQVSKWTPISKAEARRLAPEGLIGNVRPNYDKAKGKFVFISDNTNWIKFPTISAVMSSALFLYRLLCLFETEVQVEPINDRYKCIWWITLKHKESGELLQFGEWKGAAGTWTRFHCLEDLPETFKRDYVLLLNELCSKDCPHPYDGLVAGSVA